MLLWGLGSCNSITLSWFKPRSRGCLIDASWTGRKRSFPLLAGARRRYTRRGSTLDASIGIVRQFDLTCLGCSGQKRGQQGFCALPLPTGILFRSTARLQYYPIRSGSLQVCDLGTVFGTWPTSRVWNGMWKRSASNIQVRTLWYSVLRVPSWRRAKMAPMTMINPVLSPSKLSSALFYSRST